MCTLGSEITLLNSFIRFVVLAFETAPPTPQHTHIMSSRNGVKYAVKCCTNTRVLTLTGNHQHLELIIIKEDFIMSNDKV